MAAGSVIQMMHLGCVFTFGVFFSEFEKEFEAREAYNTETDSGDKKKLNKTGKDKKTIKKKVE